MGNGSLSAQDSDKHINQFAPKFFAAFPDMETLSQATPEAIAELISDVRNFGNISNWLSELSKNVKKEKNIPLTLDVLTELPGICRKSANVIKGESGTKAEGVMVYLQVVRVAPMFGIATGADPKKIEKQMMDVWPQKQ